MLYFPFNHVSFTKASPRITSYYFPKGADAIRRLAASLQAAGLVYIPENGIGKIETGLALLVLQRIGFSDCVARGQAELMQWSIFRYI